MLLASLVRNVTQTAPDRPALIAGGQTWSYGQLDEAATRLARGWLADGLEVGDRVALLPNGPEAMLTYPACFRAGMIAVPLEYRYQPPQMNDALRHCGARAIVVHADRQAELAECDASRGLDVLVVGGTALEAG